MNTHQSYPQKSGILLAAFGSSNPVGQQALGVFEQHIRDIFPDIPVRWAFTSDHIRSQLAAAKKKSDSVQKAIMRMAFEKFTHIAVQSLHLIPGVEYESLQENIRIVSAKGCLYCTLGKPLLFSPEDHSWTAQALLEHLPEKRQAHEAVLCMGHGTWHEGGASYKVLAQKVHQADPFVFIGTLEGGGNDIHSHIPKLRAAGIKTVWLLPLLSVVGKHAITDMAGEQNNSWQSILTAEGFTCHSVLKGTVEYNGFARIWTKHLQKAVQELAL